MVQLALEPRLCHSNVLIESVTVKVTSVAVSPSFPHCIVQLKQHHHEEEDEEEDEEEGGAVSPLISVCLYGGCGSALSAWISCWAQLSVREDGETSGVFPPSDSASLHPLVPHRRRLPPAHQTCQTSSRHHLLG